MAQAYNKSQVKLIIDGDEVVELADSEDAVLCPDSMPALTATRGATGALMVVGTGDPGGPISVTVLPIPATDDAPNDAPWPKWDDLLQQARDGEALEPIQGTLEVPDRTYELVNGFCVDGPMGQTYGKGSAGNRTYVFEWEQIRTP